MKKPGKRPRQPAKPIITAARAKGRGSKVRNRAIFRKSKTPSSTVTATRFYSRSIRSAVPPAMRATAAVFFASAPARIGTSLPSVSSIPKRFTRSERAKTGNPEGEPRRNDHRALQEVGMENFDHEPELLSFDRR